MSYSFHSAYTRKTVVFTFLWQVIFFCISFLSAAISELKSTYVSFQKPEIYLMHLSSLGQNNVGELRPNERH